MQASDVALCNQRAQSEARNKWYDLVDLYDKQQPANIGLDLGNARANMT